MPLIANTPNLLELIKDSEGRNQGPTQELIDLIDPDGHHVIDWSMDHNGVELRNFWLIKLIDRDEPVELKMDNSYELTNLLTYELKGEDKEVRCSCGWDSLKMSPPEVDPLTECPACGQLFDSATGKEES